MHFCPLAQLFQFVLFSFRGVSPFLNESSDLIVSFTGLFIFVFLRIRHNFSLLFLRLHVAAAAFVSLPRWRVVVSTATSLVSAWFAISFEWCVVVSALAAT